MFESMWHMFGSVCVICVLTLILKRVHKPAVVTGDAATEKPFKRQNMIRSERFVKEQS